MVELQQEEPLSKLKDDQTPQWLGCDKCSARAAILVELPYGELTFCRHHYNVYAEALTKDAGIATLLA